MSRSIVTESVGLRLLYYIIQLISNHDMAVLRVLEMVPLCKARKEQMRNEKLQEVL